MRKDFIHGAALFMLAASAVGLTACSSDDEASKSTPRQANLMTLQIKLGSLIEGGTTRATDLTYGSAADYNDINRLTLAVVNASGDIVASQDMTASAATVMTDPSFNQATEFIKGSDGTVTAQMVNTQMKAGDEVLCAINGPSNTFFTGLTTKTAFNDKTIDIDQAINNTEDASKKGVSAVTNMIPMYGSSTLQATSDDDKFTATINPERLVAKIVINSIKADFSGNATYKNGVFVPTGIYIMSAAQYVKFNTKITYDNDGKNAVDASWGTNSTFYQGWYENDGSMAMKYKAYLSMPKTTADDAVYLASENQTMPILNDTLISGSTDTKYIVAKDSKATKNEWTPNKVLLTTPNGSNASKPGSVTRIIILGKFYPQGAKSTTGWRVMYTLPINVSYNATTKADEPAEANTQTNAIYHNRQYNCKITLKNPGVKLSQFTIGNEAATPDPTDSGTDKPIDQNPDTGETTGGGTQPGDGTSPFDPLVNKTAEITVTVSPWTQVNQNTSL